MTSWRKNRRHPKVSAGSGTAAERRRELAAFLPAALEIQETPPHPVARRLFWLLLAFLLLAALWMLLGKVSIVAVARGKIIPESGVKVIQPLEKGVITGIRVKEGELVRQGQVLVELDATSSTASRKQLQQELARLEAAMAVHRRLLELIETEQDAAAEPGLQLGEELGDDDRRLYASLLRQQWIDYRTGKLALQSAWRQVSAERATVQVRIRKLEQTLPIVEQRMNNLETLQGQNFVSTNDFLLAKQEHIQQKQDLAALRQDLLRLVAAGQEAKQQIRLHRAQSTVRLLSELAESRKKRAGLLEELEKIRNQEKHQLLKAPISGRVQDLVIHTLGGVVTPAQELMRIVPQQRKLEVEAYLSNQDVGFVEEGMPAQVKIRAFPFTRYGLVEARRLQVSDDAIQDPDRGLLYRLRLQLADDRLKSDGREYRLQPGMEVTVEMHTGERRIIEFFLSPLQRHRQESLRER